MATTLLLKRRPILLAALAAFALSLTALGGRTRVGGDKAPTQALGPASRVLVIAIDGLSWDVFQVAKQRGLFKRVPYAGRHVTPYPSMSHPAWNEVVGGRRFFGARGNVRTIEARWFDLDAMRVADDPRQVIARHASPYGYSRVWDYFFDPLVEPLMYLPGRKLFDRELREAEHAMLNDFTGDRFVAYVSGLDAIAHTHRGELWPYLERLDAMISRVADSLDARREGGETPAELWLVSDHGNAGGFAEGESERYLKTVSLDAAIRRAGLARNDTGRLEQSNHVAVTTIALASMVNVYFADLGRRRALATSALEERGVELVTWLEVMTDDRFVVILGAGGEARLRWRDGFYSYERVRGNPLSVPDSQSSARGARRWISDAVMRDATAWGPYPDAPFRLAQSADKQVENAPDLIVNLGDGYAHRGDLGRYVRMVRTHGSLSARPSLGVLASSSRVVPSHVRSQEILDVIGLRPEQLFTRSANLRTADPLALARMLARGPRRVATGKDDESRDMTFLRRARPIVLSMDYFQLDAMRVLMHAASSEQKSSRLSASRDLLRRADVVRGIANNVDTLLALVDSIDARTLPALARRAERRAREIPELAPLAELRAVWARGNEPAGAGAPIRRGAMALWTLPYFLDAALAAPEWDSIPDPRDPVFAEQWHGGLRARIAADPERLLDDTTVGRRVFEQVFAERKLMRSIEPATIPALYDPDVSDMTVVYIPGIYDELFDGEIWSRGLRSVRDRLGVRTVAIPVDGRCGSSINAERIVAALGDDTRRRWERGYDVPRYVIIGYSKGGIDALEALSRAPKLAREQVSALVSIATPHRGTPVAERSDVPASLVKWSVVSRAPAACDSSGASESLWPATRSAFWASQNDGRDLAPLTRYFSLSFVADMAGSHPWMKLTKQIGQFPEPNDGVVSLSSSRFPGAVQATDLGIVHADHIAGRLASSFPQDAFLEAVVIAAAELGAFRPRAGEQWRRMLASRDASLWRALRRRYAGDDGRDVRVSAFPAALRAPSALPGGGTGWSAQRTFRMGNVDFDKMHVREMNPGEHPNGIVFRCDQRSMEEFRREHEFFYDAGNGGGDDGWTNGFSIAAAPGSAGGRACRLATTATAMKMTTVAYRFRPRDYPSLRLRLRVAKNPTGVDDSKSGHGKNDAAFKLWLILKDRRAGADDGVVLFGYVWPGADSRGLRPADGTLLEARSSRRNVVLTTLPEAWLVAVGAPADEQGWKTIERDLAGDLARAYPGIPAGALQVVGITMQSDSDESSSASEVYLESVAIERRPVRPMALVKAASLP